MIDKQFPTGKGILIWKCDNFGTFDQIFEAVHRMRLNWVGVKIGDAASDRTASTDRMLMPILVNGLKQMGVKVWAWHYLDGGVQMIKPNSFIRTGASPTEEAAFAVEQIVKYNFDGYIADVEKEYKVLQQGTRAAEFLTALRRGLPAGMAVGLCSYRFPRLHPELDWAAWCKGVDFHMPQVYWGPGHAVSDLDASIQQLTALAKLPIIPLGRAYIGDGHPAPTGEEVSAFAARAADRGCLGVGFWALDFLKLHHGGAELENAIGGIEWTAAGPTDPGQSAGWFPAVLGKVQVVAAQGMNVRSGPGVKYADMGDLAPGGVFYYTALSADRAWAQIGVNMWVALGDTLARLIV